MRTWVKLYTEILDDHKLETMSEHLFKVCIKLIAVAGKVDRDGELGELGQVALYLRQDEKSTQKDLQDLEKTRVTCNKNGIWKLKNFKDRNGKSPSASREAVSKRVRKYRENRYKNDDEKQTGNEGVTTFQNDVTRLEEIRVEEIRVDESGADAPHDTKSKNGRLLPAPIKTFIDSGGKFKKDKREKAIAFILENVKDTPESLALWARVVDGYTTQWSAFSYTVMVNDYYLHGRIPGQRNTNGAYRQPATPPQFEKVVTAADIPSIEVSPEEKAKAYELLQKRLGKK